MCFIELRAAKLCKRKSELDHKKRYTSFTFYFKVILSHYTKAVKIELKDVAGISEINQDGETALHTASGYGDNPEIILLLLREGAFWNAMDKNGCAPVHLAADINGTSEEGENCLLSGALYDSSKSVKKQFNWVSARHGSIETIPVIACVNPNTVTAEDNEKNQPLSHCRGGTSVKRLADFGAAVDHQNGEGKTALRVLAAEPTLAEGWLYGCTPLHAAARMENDEAIDLLLASGFEVTKEDKEGNTPLLVALDKQYREIAEKIVHIPGAKVTGSNRDGW
ncbi:26S proteasome non-ATPase regulatory subunit 10-like [Oscarella lobularis]|uniref:26S proteasome non-ATPase regulatory subunit 10-like n=1 Tax=Oscarella lobularis TaxID=121494 RepID=UPI0033132C8E